MRLYAIKVVGNSPDSKPWWYSSESGEWQDNFDETCLWGSFDGVSGFLRDEQSEDCVPDTWDLAEIVEFDLTLVNPADEDTLAWLGKKPKNDMNKIDIG